MAEDKNMRKLYDVVRSKGLYSRTYDEFVEKYGKAENRGKLYDVVTSEGLYTKPREEFENQYFSWANVAPEEVASVGAQMGADVRRKTEERQRRTGMMAVDWINGMQGMATPDGKGMTSEGLARSLAENMPAGARESDVVWGESGALGTKMEGARYVKGGKGDVDKVQLTEEERNEARRRGMELWNGNPNVNMQSFIDIEERLALARKRSMMEGNLVVRSAVRMDNSTAEGRRINQLADAYAKMANEGGSTIADVNGNAMAMFMATAEGQDAYAEYVRAGETEKAWEDLSKKMYNRYKSYIDTNVQNVVEVDSDRETKLMDEKLARLGMTPDKAWADNILSFVPNLNPGRLVAYVENKTLDAAQGYNTATKNMLEAVKTEGGLEAFRKGLGDSVMDLETWVAMAEVGKNAEVLRVVNKIEKSGVESLDEKESLLMEALTTNACTAMYLSGKVNGWYKAGETTGMSLPFMLEFLVAPFSAADDVIAKGMGKFAAKMIGKKATGKVMNGAIRYGAKLGTGWVAAHTLGAPKIAAGMLDRMAGETVFGKDADTGELSYKGQEKRQDAWSAFRNADIETTMEYMSERMVDPIANKLKGGFRGWIARDGGMNELFRVVNGAFNGSLAKKAAFSGIVGEYAEEMVGALGTALLCSDQNLQDNFSGERLEETFWGLLPTQLAFSMVGLGGGIVQNKRINNSAKKMEQEIMGMLQEGGMPESFRESGVVADLTKKYAKRMRETVADMQADEESWSEERVNGALNDMRAEYNRDVCAALGEAAREEAAGLAAQEELNGEQGIESSRFEKFAEAMDFLSARYDAEGGLADEICERHGIGLDKLREIMAAEPDALSDAEVAVRNEWSRELTKRAMIAREAKRQEREIDGMVGSDGQITEVEVDGQHGTMVTPGESVSVWRDDDGRLRQTASANVRVLGVSDPAERKAAATEAAANVISVAVDHPMGSMVNVDGQVYVVQDAEGDEVELWGYKRGQKEPVQMKMPVGELAKLPQFRVKSGAVVSDIHITGYDEETNMYVTETGEKIDGNALADLAAQKGVNLSDPEMYEEKEKGGKDKGAKGEGLNEGVAEGVRTVEDAVREIEGMRAEGIENYGENAVREYEAEAEKARKAIEKKRGEMQKYGPSEVKGGKLAEAKEFIGEQERVISESERMAELYRLAMEEMGETQGEGVATPERSGAESGVGVAAHERSGAESGVGVAAHERTEGDGVLPHAEAQGAQSGAEGVTPSVSESGKGKNRGRKLIERSLEKMKAVVDRVTERGEMTDEDADELFSAWANYESNVKHGADVTEGDSMFVDLAMGMAKEHGYEPMLHIGDQYHHGMKVISNFVVDDSLQPGEMVITRMRNPGVYKNGVMIKAAEVTVAQGVESKEDVKREIEDLAKRFGVGVEFSEEKRMEDGRAVYGAFKKESGKVVVYINNVDDVNRAKAVYMHEVVGHYGLAQMFKGREDLFEELMARVYEGMDEKARGDVEKRASANKDWGSMDGERRQRLVAEEYVAELAEEYLGREKSGKLDEGFLAKVRSVLAEIMMYIEELVGSGALTEGECMNVVSASARWLEGNRKKEEEPVVEKSSEGVATPERSEGDAAHERTEGAAGGVAESGKDAVSERKDMVAEFVKDIKEPQKTRISDILNKKFNYDGKIMTRAEHVESLKEQGAIFYPAPWKGKEQGGYRLGRHDYFFTKTECDYARFIGATMASDEFVEFKKARDRMSVIAGKWSTEDIDRRITERERWLRAGNPNTTEGKRVVSELADLREYKALKEKWYGESGFPVEPPIVNNQPEQKEVEQEEKPKTVMEMAEEKSKELEKPKEEKKPKVAETQKERKKEKVGALSEKEMLKFAQKTNERKPFMTGVFHDDKNKVAVATDVHVLFISEQSYNEKYAGKSIGKDGKEVGDRYANYEMVIPTDGIEQGVDLEKLRSECERLMKAVKTLLKSKTFKAYYENGAHSFTVQLNLNNGKNVVLFLDQLNSMFDISDKLGIAKMFATESSKAVVFKGEGKNMFLIMPAFMRDRQKATFEYDIESNTLTRGLEDWRMFGVDVADENYGEVLSGVAEELGGKLPFTPKNVVAINNEAEDEKDRRKDNKYDNLEYNDNNEIFIDGNYVGHYLESTGGYELTFNFEQAAMFDEETRSKMKNNGEWWWIEFDSKDDMMKFYESHKDIITEEENEEDGDEQEDEGVKSVEERSEGATEKIEDVGEKIGGARKDATLNYARKIDLNEKTPSKIFPKPNFASMEKAGVPHDTLVKLKVYYTAFGTTNSKKIRRNAEQRLLSAKFYGALAKELLLRDVDVKSENVEGIALTDYGKEHIDYLTKCIEALDKNGHGDLFELDLSDVMLGISNFTEDDMGFYKGSDGRRWVQTNSKDKSERLVIVGDKLFALDDIDGITAEYAELAGKTHNKSVKDEIKFTVYRRGDGICYIAAKVRGVREMITIKDGFATSREAFAYMRENEDEMRVEAKNKAEEQKSGQSGEGRSLSNDELERALRDVVSEERIGKDYRNGKDVTAEDFRSQFGFRGVEFGNWATQKERQDHLNACYDALMDLAELLGVSPRALSLSGKLGFAFGSRGHSGAAAHYEPAKHVINLTKKHGAGAVAHEWFHALDTYFGGGEFGLSENMATTGNQREGMRDEVRELFAELSKALHSSDMSRRSGKIDVTKSKPYWGTTIEMAARAFETYVNVKMMERGQRNQYLSAHIPGADAKVELLAKNDPYPTAEESKVFGDIFDRLFDTIQERENKEGERELFSVGERLMVSDESEGERVEREVVDTEEVLEKVRRREPKYRGDAAHKEETMTEFFDRYAKWRDEMYYMKGLNDEAREEYQLRFNDEVPAFPVYVKGMPLAEYLNSYDNYRKGIDGMAMVRDANRAQGWLRKAVGDVERFMFDRNETLGLWQQRLARVMGVERLDESYNVLDALTRCSSATRAKADRFKAHQMRAVSEAIAAISKSAAVDGFDTRWQEVESRRLFKKRIKRPVGVSFRREDGSEWRPGWRWANVDKIDTKEGDRREGQELSPYEVISLYLQALHAVENRKMGLPDAGLEGFERQIVTDERNSVLNPITADEVIAEFEDAIGRERCERLQRAVYDATSFAMRTLVNGGLISQERYNEVMGYGLDPLRRFIMEHGAEKSDGRVWKNEFAQSKAVANFAPELQYIDLEDGVKYSKEDILARCRRWLLPTDEYNLKHYVPARGWAEEESLDDTEWSPVLIEAEGRTSLSADPLMYVAIMAHTAINTAERNKAKQALWRLANDQYKLGLTTGAFRMKQWWDYEWLDEDGNVQRKTTSAPPSSELYKHNKQLVDRRNAAINKRVENEMALQRLKDVDLPNAQRMVDNAQTDEEREEAKRRMSVVSGQITKRANVIDKLTNEIDEINKQVVEIEKSGEFVNYNGYRPDTDSVVTVYVQGSRFEIIVGTLGGKSVDRKGKEHYDFVDSRKVTRNINGRYATEKMDRRARAMQDATFFGTFKLSDATKFLSALKTQYSVGFAFANFVRDVQFAGWMNFAEHGAGYAAKAWKNAVAPSTIGVIGSYLTGHIDERKREAMESGDEERLKVIAMFEDFAENGGITGYSFAEKSPKVKKELMSMIDQAERRLRRKEARDNRDLGAIETLWQQVKYMGDWEIGEKLGFLSQLSELMTRFGQYRTAIGEGKGVAEATQEAKEITTNFNRSAEISAFLGPLFMFTNATLQGTYRIVLGLRKSPKARRRFAEIYLLHVVAGALMAAFGGDDPDEERFIPDWLWKTSCVMGGVALPLSHFFRNGYYMGANLMFALQGKKSIPEALFDTVSSTVGDCLPDCINLFGALEYDNKNESKSDSIFGSGLDLNWKKLLRQVIPAIVQPWTDVWMNMNFTGQPIRKSSYSQRDEGTENQTRMYYSNANEWVVNFCEWLQMATGGRTGGQFDTNGVTWNPSDVSYLIRTYGSGAAVDAFKLVYDIWAVGKHYLSEDEHELPRARDVFFINRFVKPYEQDRMDNYYYWDVQENHKNFNKYLKECKRDYPEEYERLVKSGKVELWNEESGALGRMGEKMKEGVTLDNEEIKQLQEWARRWNELSEGKAK